jgi:hypothetical protein
MFRCQWWSNGTTTSTSSSSWLSTRCLMEGGDNRQSHTRACRQQLVSRRRHALHQQHVHHWLAAPCVPIASIATAHFHVELNRRHEGKDSRITVERQCERHHNLEARNLEKVFSYLAPTREARVACATHSPSSPAATGGCMALAPHLCMVVWPCKFLPHPPEMYDGAINPIEFLQIYSTSILATGGNEAVMVNYFPMDLIGMTQSWLMNLPEGTLTSWQELCRQFMTNFESSCSRPFNKTDLHVVQQRQGELLCSFIQRFSQICNTIPRIFNASVVVALR